MCLQLKYHVPAGKYYSVVEHNVLDQVSEVLTHFNVSVSVSDIFSRCLVSSCSLPAWELRRGGYAKSEKVKIAPTLLSNENRADSWLQAISM